MVDCPLKTATHPTTHPPLHRYSVPACDADALEGVASRTVFAPAAAELAAAGADEAAVRARAERALMGKTTVFSPRLLLDNSERAGGRAATPPC